MRYASIKDGRIKIISDHAFAHAGTQILPIPIELDDVSNNDLLLDYKVKDGKFSSSSTKKPADQLKVAFITNWQQQCGISTYAENLIPEIIKFLGDYRLFIEYNDAPTNQALQNHTITCWKRGQPLTDLVKAIKEYDPDIIVFNHEYGLFPNASHWLSCLSQLSEYRIISILHSVFPAHLDKTICEAAIPEIVVHQEGAKLALHNDKQIQSKIYVIPHGCYAVSNTTPLWNLYQTPHTFIQQGFGFRYKGFDQSLRAVALLKDKYPDVFFTALFSESPFNKIGHQLYFNELMDLAKTLDIQDHIAILRGYQSEATIDSYMRTNKVAVFSYSSSPGHEVFGASGAARLAFSKGIPVISSSIPHFQDLPTIKADNPQEIAAALDHLFAHPQAQKDQIAKQLSFIDKNSWKNVAHKFIDLFEGRVIL